MGIHIEYHAAPHRPAGIGAAPSVTQRLARFIGRGVVTGDQLQRRQIREIPLGIVFLVDGQHALSQVTHDGRRCRIAGARRRAKIEILRGRPRLKHREQ